MKATITITTFLAFGAVAAGTNPYWQPGADLTRVRPSIGPTVFDVTKYGAVGDKTHDDTQAIQTALDKCVESKDGGVVLLPNKKASSNTAVGSTGRGALSEPVIPAEDGSVYLSYPLVLDHATGCAIVIEPRVTLLAKPWSSKKAPTDRYKGAFIGIDNCDNVGIGGGGTIRGNGQTWWFGPGGVPWPELIRVESSKNIALHNITAMDSAFHHLEMFANNFEISHLQILIDWSHPKPSDKEYSPCTDGIDVHGSPAYIHNTVIDVGDDNIAVDASNVRIEDCHFGGPATCAWGKHGRCVHGHGATIGSLKSKSKVENVTFTNIVMERINEGPRVKVRCKSTDGFVKNIKYENLVLHNIQSKNFNIFTNYDCKKGDEGVSLLPVAWETIRRETWSNYTLYRSPDGVIFRSLENALAAAAAANKTQMTPPPLEKGKDTFVVSDLVFKNITTTGSPEQGGFFCSKDIPCGDITMSEIHSDKGGMQCNSADGKAMDNSPAITCL